MQRDTALVSSCNTSIQAAPCRHLSPCNPLSSDGVAAQSTQEGPGRKDVGKLQHLINDHVTKDISKEENARLLCPSASCKRSTLPLYQPCTTTIWIVSCYHPKCCSKLFQKTDHPSLYPRSRVLQPENAVGCPTLHEHISSPAMSRQSSQPAHTPTVLPQALKHTQRLSHCRWAPRSMRWSIIHEASLHVKELKKEKSVMSDADLQPESWDVWWCLSGELPGESTADIF